MLIRPPADKAENISRLFGPAFTIHFFFLKLCEKKVKNQFYLDIPYFSLFPRTIFEMKGDHSISIFSVFSLRFSSLMAVDNHCEWSESWRIKPYPHYKWAKRAFQLALSVCQDYDYKPIWSVALEEVKVCCIVHFLSTLLGLLNGQWPTPLPDLDGAKALNNKNNWHSLSIDVKK